MAAGEQQLKASQGQKQDAKSAAEKPSLSNLDPKRNSRETCYDLNSCEKAILYDKLTKTYENLEYVETRQISLKMHENV